MGGASGGLGRSMRTRITELFDIRYPVMSAPMTSHSGGQLAAAVSLAGGLGSFGGIHPAGADWLLEQVGLVRSRTDNPFAVGFLTQYIPDNLPIFHAVLEEEVPAIAFSFSDPAPWLGLAKEAGALTLCQVQDLKGADEAVAAGADVLVAQGNAAGGHTGGLNLLPFLCSVIDRYPQVPVMASGGISDGRTLAAVLSAGAEGAWMGTAFVATTEAIEVPNRFKEVIVRSDGEDTTFTRVYDLIDNGRWPEGVAARVYRNSFVNRWHGREGEIEAHREELSTDAAAAWANHDPEGASVYMGTSAALVKAVRPAAEVLIEACSEAESILRNRWRELEG